MGEVGLRTVRDGNRPLSFQAAVLGAATSQRGSAPRWSELVVYRLTDGTYLVSKIGRSAVAHRPDCGRVNQRMISWRDAQRRRDDSEARVYRLPCPECRPKLDPPAPDTMLEVTRYRAILARDAESAVQSLMVGDRTALMAFPKLVQNVLDQCAQVDPCFARYAEADSAPKALEKTTRTG
jgi:hypothetical protein